MRAIKKLFFVLIVLVAPYWGYLQYIQYIRFKAPSDYDYKVNEGIDKNYHNPETVKQFYQAVYEVGNIARNCWYENQIDVRMFDGGDSRYALSIAKYHQAKASAAFLEQKLLNSAAFKKAGFGSEDIRYAEELGATLDQYPLAIAKHKAQKWTNGVLQSGDNNAEVLFIQKILAGFGKELPTDGFYENITKAKVAEFQKESGLYANGVVNDITLAMMIQKSVLKK